MPLSHRRLTRAVPVILLLLAAPALAQSRPAGDLARQAEFEAKVALREAVRLADQSPERSADKLRQLITRLETDTFLPADRRGALLRVAKDRLRVVTAGPVATTEPPVAVRPVGADAEHRAAEAGQVRAALSEVAALSKAGKPAEAGQKLAALLHDHPNELTLQAQVTARRVDEQRAGAAATRQEMERSALAGLGAVDRAAVVPRDELTVPPEFKERAAKRRADTAPTAAELKILQALNTPVDAKFKDSPLQDVAETFSTLIGLPVVLDKGALDDNRLDYATPVTFGFRGRMAARTVLRALLAQLGLTYVIKDGVVFVTTSARAREFLVTKVYSLGDLVIPTWDLANPFQNEFANAAMLIEAITSTIDPLSWDFRGGAGTIRYYPPLRALIVRQSAEMQTMIRGSLYK